MKITEKPSKALHPAYRKISVTRNEINSFKTSLNTCLEHIRISDEKNESEENIKGYIKPFLKEVFYEEYLINTKDKIDLAIYAGKDATSNVSVLIEAKRPSNKSEFLKKDNLNRKALQELLLYYLRERVTLENNQIKHLIATNGYEWYFFKGEDFYNTFYKNKKLLKEYNQFLSGQKDSSKNDLFYNEIAKKYIEEVKEELPFLYIDIRKDFQELLDIQNTDDDKLVSLYKVFSPIHLLAQAYGNDSNQLNKQFYYELLHLIGLEEVKEKGKKVIQRKQKADRNDGSLLETTIYILEDRDYLRKVNQLKNYGKDKEEQLFNVALELSLTWINRILFLKLLEAQLVTYNQDEKYKFLHTDFVKDFDDLEELFFSALAKKIEDRNERIKEKYNHIPYLNSSLFEPNTLEDSALQISNLKELELELYEKTVLKDNLKRLTGTLPVLEYIFKFLEAYDFSGETGEKVDESNQNKTLISASVLGLIFEKINGYKDGSFYTPAYITMYMAKQTLRRAVVEKFNTHYAWKCNDFEALQEDLKDYIRNGDREAIRKEANQIINSLKICDPAVGSGHFLVSVLNELIAIKSELGVLIDKDGKRLNAYIEIDNDELVVEDENETIFAYQPKNKNSQRLQETLFHEKQTLIENCLFGVDINPNSVKICRLRLWIELLKNAYYTEENQLQTLPNIDINIKTGNSLISRFELDEDLKNAFKSKENPYSLEDYKNAVEEYKNTKNKDRKREIVKIIDTIKSAFTGTLDSKFKKKIATARGKLEQKQTEVQNLEAFGEKPSKKLKTELKKAKLTLQKVQDEKESILNNIIYQNAFEWRFEFPEVLDKNGKFVGFDVVIGNPPYTVVERTRNTTLEPYKNILEYSKLTNRYEEVLGGKLNLYRLFIKLSHDISKTNSYLSMIIPLSLVGDNSLESTRRFIFDSCEYLNLDCFPQKDNASLRVFEDAKVSTLILLSKKIKKRVNDSSILVNTYPHNSFSDKPKSYLTSVEKIIEFDSFKVCIPLLNQTQWNLLTKLHQHPPIRENESIIVRRGEINQTVYREYITDKKSESNANLIKGVEISQYKINLKLSQGKKEYLNEEQFFKDGKNNPLINVRRISTQRITGTDEKLRLVATIAPLKSYLADSTNSIHIEKQSFFKLEFVLGLLNSKVFQWRFKATSSNNNVSTTEIQSLPIPKTPNKETQTQIEEKVTQILSLKQSNPSTDTSELENEIDILVYKLYDLSYEEVLLIDTDFGWSEQEYNSK